MEDVEVIDDTQWLCGNCGYMASGTVCTKCATPKPHRLQCPTCGCELFVQAWTIDADTHETILDDVARWMCVRCNTVTWKTAEGETPAGLHRLMFPPYVPAIHDPVGKKTTH